MEKIKKLRKLFNQYNLDGYIVPKNNNFFGEYVSLPEDNLKYISNFTGSAGFAIILRNKNFMFVDGRYTTQANIQSGKNYKIFTIPQSYPFNVFNNKNLNLGFDPKLHTAISLDKLFKNIERAFFRDSTNFKFVTTLYACLNSISTIYKHIVFIFKNNSKTSRPCKIRDIF